MELKMIRILSLLCCWGLFGNAYAVLTIDITQGIEGALPIAIVPFGGSGARAPEDIAGIISSDLRRSGRFSPFPTAKLPARPVQAAQVDFQTWRILGSRNLVIGQLTALPGNRYAVEFELFDVLRSERITGYRFDVISSELRYTAHRISDMIYQALTGERGAFNSRIAYVTVRKTGKIGTWRLEVADADGANGRTILTSKEPLLSPNWAPSGKTIAYVSLENKRTAVYVQNIATGKRHQVAAWPGLNTAPAWSPEGGRLALSLSKDGNPEIYILNLRNRNLRRLTNNSAIDTEPAWSPDGNHIVFTSGRGGSAQIYRMPSNGGSAQRLTFEGYYNAGASYSPDGRKLVLLHGNRSAYRIAILDLTNGQLDILTNTVLDESPSFAPNGSMVIYSAGKELAAVSVDGRVRHRLHVAGGEEVREPVWSPFNKE
ncbi:MAG: Tol-Pal system beta propeller repeat protein TolB [Gammaproteobacteria bacterium]|nr:Tol-Pal system beta propeller repeat protein TolB [Gammaproteobacteria bacterium]